jgi:hypothetical protein
MKNIYFKDLKVPKRNHKDVSCVSSVTLHESQATSWFESKELISSMLHNDNSDLLHENSCNNKYSNVTSFLLDGVTLQNTICDNNTNASITCVTDEHVLHSISLQNENIGYKPIYKFVEIDSEIASVKLDLVCSIIKDAADRKHSK